MTYRRAQNQFDRNRGLQTPGSNKLGMNRFYGQEPAREIIVLAQGGPDTSDGSDGR